MTLPVILGLAAGSAWLPARVRLIGLTGVLLALLQTWLLQRWGAAAGMSRGMLPDVWLVFAAILLSVGMGVAAAHRQALEEFQTASKSRAMVAKMLVEAPRELQDEEMSLAVASAEPVAWRNTLSHLDRWVRGRRSAWVRQPMVAWGVWLGECLLATGVVAGWLWSQRRPEPRQGQGVRA